MHVTLKHPWRRLCADVGVTSVEMWEKERARRLFYCMIFNLLLVPQFDLRNFFRKKKQHQKKQSSKEYLPLYLNNLKFVLVRWVA